MIISPGLPEGFRNFSQVGQLALAMREICGPSLLSYIDPGTDSSITTAGGAVAVAADLGNYGNNATQPNAGNRPTHSQVTDSISFVSASSQYMAWVVPPAAGTVWAWVRMTGGSVAWGAYSTGVLRMWLQGAGGTWMAIIGSTSLPSGVAVSGAWQFTCVTWDGAGNVSITVDGTRTTGGYLNGTPGHAIYLGARNVAGAPDSFLGGSIGQHGILTRVCSAAEIAAIRTLTYRAP